MKKRSWLIIIILMPLLLIPFALCGDETVELESLVTEAGRNNLELKKRAIAADEAKEGLGGFFKIDESELSVSGNYDFAGEGEPGSPDSASVSLVLPIITQLQIEGSFDTRGTGRVGLSLSPLAFDTAGYRAEENYRKALNELSYQKKRTALDIEAAVLNYNKEIVNSEHLEAVYRLEEKKRAAVQKQYQLGRTGYQELQDSGTAYLNARQKYIDGERSRLSAQQTLYAIIGPGLEKAVIPGVSIETLLDLIQKRNLLIQEEASGEVSTERLKSLNLELERLKKELRVTFPVQPLFSVSAEADLPYSSVTTRGSLSFSKNSFKFDERKDLGEEIALKTREIEAEKYRANLEKELLLNNIRIADEDMTMNEQDKENAEITLEETKFLFERGERTTLELKQAELNLVAAEIRVYLGALNRYKAQGEYLLLF